MSRSHTAPSAHSFASHAEPQLPLTFSTRLTNAVGFRGDLASSPYYEEVDFDKIHPILTALRAAVDDFELVALLGERGLCKYSQDKLEGQPLLTSLRQIAPLYYPDDYATSTKIKMYQPPGKELSRWLFEQVCPEVLAVTWREMLPGLMLDTYLPVAGYDVSPAAKLLWSDFIAAVTKATGTDPRVDYLGEFTSALGRIAAGRGVSELGFGSRSGTKGAAHPWFDPDKDMRLMPRQPALYAKLAAQLATPDPSAKAPQLTIACQLPYGGDFIRPRNLPTWFSYWPKDVPRVRKLVDWLLDHEHLTAEMVRGTWLEWRKLQASYPHHLEAVLGLASDQDLAYYLVSLDNGALKTEDYKALPMTESMVRRGLSWYAKNHFSARGMQYTGGWPPIVYVRLRQLGLLHLLHEEKLLEWVNIGYWFEFTQYGAQRRPAIYYQTPQEPATNTTKTSCQVHSAEFIDLSIDAIATDCKLASRVFASTYPSMSRQWPDCVRYIMKLGRYKFGIWWPEVRKRAAFRKRTEIINELRTHHRENAAEWMDWVMRETEG